MKKLKLGLALALLTVGVYAQTVNPNQIRPSPINGQVLTTVAGTTAWASGGLPYPNVKSQFGALGNGTTDDAAALNTALAYAQANNVPLFFPCGEYLVESQLTWNTSVPLILIGESSTCAYIFYGGTASVTAALSVHNTTTPSNGYFSNVNLSNIGFAANANALYALSLWRTSGTIDTVDAMGGSASAFEGQGFNAQGDIRNLRVNPISFNPSNVGCVNGITLTTDGGLASTNFSMESPNVGACSGIGYNFSNAGQITVSGAQESGAYQGFTINCTADGCNGTGVHFQDSLLGEGATVSSTVYSTGNHFSDVNFGSSLLVDIYGSRTIIDDSSIGSIDVESSSFGSIITENNLDVSSIDNGVSTIAFGNIRIEDNLPWYGAFNTMYSPNFSSFYQAPTGFTAPVGIKGGNAGYFYLPASTGTSTYCYGGSIIGGNDSNEYGGVWIRALSSQLGQTCGGETYSNILGVFGDQVTAPVPYVGLGFIITEGSGLPGSANKTTFDALSSSHLWRFNRSNAGPLYGLGIASAAMAGHCPQFATNGIDLVDSGSTGCGGGAWSSLTNPTGNLPLSMGSYTSTFTSGAGTGSGDLWKWTDTASNTGTGILGHFTTASGSTETPFAADANGVGFKVDNLGRLVGYGSTLPASVQYPAGSGTLPALTANSYGFLGPVTGGTSYLLQFPSTITAGLAQIAAPATVNGVNVAQVTPATASQVAAAFSGQAITPSAYNQSTANSTGGSCTMSSSTTCTITIGHTYTTPLCIAVQETASPGNFGWGCLVSGTTVTITAATSNSGTFAAFVFGNPN
jgi:pectate lyase-like protein